MVVKTITIDLEAYGLLSRHKREGQSFSQVIKEHFAGKKKGKDLLAALKHVQVTDQTLDAIEEQVRSRVRYPAKAPDL
ncbi:MAG TPA: antitoxin VapB family protein [Thermoanaerobaculia bacterium]|nr:antitoxin VapB family protein [Thermoanaerobaculia bacterium]